MILRPRQIQSVERSVAALREKGNTLLVAPTGAGKTVMLSAVAGQFGSALILQHRDELVAQNRATFRKINPRMPSDLYTAEIKRFRDDGATFAMVQTLCRPANLERMKPVNLLVVDEAHHIAADTYGRIVERARELNSGTKLFGVTATPNRGDKKGLIKWFSNIADQIEITELIASGHLVPPRCFVIDVGITEELRHVKRVAADFDMGEVEAIMDKQPINERVLEEWRKHAGARRTVAFCSTVEHAIHVQQTFLAAGISAALVTGDTPDRERAEILASFDRGETQVLFNVAVLTEGWDCQPADCCILLRPCSYKSTMLQMIGRVLRRVDPERYPGIIKDDAIVLDFGRSLLVHGDLIFRVNLDPAKGEGEAPMKACPECGTEVPASIRVCPVCEHIFESKKKQALEEFILREIDVLNMSPFRWESFWEGLVSLANGLNAWAAVIAAHGRQFALGRVEDNGGVHLLSNSATKAEALAAADDFLRQHGDRDSAKKSRSWLSSPISDKQMQVLGIVDRMQCLGTSRYRASCQITWRFNERAIRAKLT